MVTVGNIAEGIASLAVPLDRVEPMPGNPRRGDVDAVARSYERFGQRKPIVARKTGGTARAPRGVVIAGNTQLAAATQLGWKKIAVVWVDEDERTAAAFSVADNRTSDVATYDEAGLAALLRELSMEDDGLLAAAGWGQDDVDELLRELARDGKQSESSGGPTLVDRFVVPPLSVLDARQGYWQERRRRWLALGIRSEEGRDENLLRFSDFVRNAGGARPAPGSGGPGALSASLAGRPEGSGLTISSLSGRVPDYYRQKRAAETAAGRALTAEEFERDYLAMPASESGLIATGTSIFDPVLCEIAYRWFSPLDGRVLDPFAGGSVRGIVAGRLGRRYIGVELQERQVEANRKQLADVGADPAPEWVAGDAREALPTGEFDLVFSCPPYADLERYSDDPRDLSAMKWPEFLAAYREIIAAACARLADDRFAVWVVGEVRARDAVDGRYRGLVPETIRAFEDAGLGFYNEAILVTPAGSVQVRVGRQFSVSRKVGKTHQNVLVFAKGDAARATLVCGDVEVEVPDPEPIPEPEQ